MGFEDILNQKAADAKAPEALPGGEYVLRVGKHVLRNVTTKNGPATVLDVFLNTVESLTADPEELSNRNIDLGKKSVKASFWIDADSMWRLTNFLEKLGLNVEDDTFANLIDDMAGGELVGVVTERPSGIVGDDRVFNDVKGFQTVAEATSA